MMPTSRLLASLLLCVLLPFMSFGQTVSKPAAKPVAKSTVSPSAAKKTDPKKSASANQVKPVKEAKVVELKEKAQTPAEKAQAQKAEKAAKVKRPKILRDADDYYNAKEYYKAIALYKKGFSKAKARTDKADVAYRLGECYRWTRRYKESNAQYARDRKSVV
jgi:hypothetical protein